MIVSILLLLAKVKLEIFQGHLYKREQCPSFYLVPVTALTGPSTELKGRETKGVGRRVGGEGRSYRIRCPAFLVPSSRRAVWW